MKKNWRTCPKLGGYHLGFGLMLLFGGESYARQIENIEFKQAEGGATTLEVRSDSALEFRLEENWRDRQVVLQFEGTKIHNRAVRALDTSSFSSPVSYIRPSRLGGTGVRIIVQFREAVKVEAEKSGAVVRLKIPPLSAPQSRAVEPSDKSSDLQMAQSSSKVVDKIRTTAAAPESAELKASTNPVKAGEQTSQASVPATGASPSGTAPLSNSASNSAKLDSPAALLKSNTPGRSPSATEATVEPLPPPTSEASAGSPPPSSSSPAVASGGTPPPGAEGQGVSIENANLAQYVGTKDSKRFTGKPITLQIKDVDVTDVLHLIGEASGFNIIVGEDVRGKISNLSLIDVPWDQALDVVLQTLRLGAERNNNVLRVATLSTLTTEKTEELRAKQAATASAPRVTRVFQVSYAAPEELSGILTKFGSSNTGGQVGGGNTGSGSQSHIQVDKRTNSIIVQDVQENIDRMKKLIELLDYQTPQVMVESKVIEANENFTRGVSGNLGFGFAHSASTTGAGVSFNGGNPLDPLYGSASAGAGAAALKSIVGPLGNGFGFSPALGFVPGMDRINAILQIGESEQQVKVVTAPRIVVLNKSTANILSATPVVINQTTALPGGGTTSTPTSVMANVSLKVTPTVTNEGSVLMDLAIDRDVPLDNSVAKRSLTTQVLVESGSTLVIGGIYTMNNNHVSSGFPLLRKIPILGALFGSDSESNNRSELFIFITPRILNEKEAGFSS
jgi:type IV pilus secretin PilQ/predicted competence protein